MSFVQSVRKASPISSFPSARTRFGKRYLSLPTIAERVSLEVENFSWPKSPTFFKASSTEGQAQPRSTALQRDPGGLTRSILTVRLYLVHLANSAFTGRRGKAVFIVLGVLLFLATTACFLADVSIDCRAVDVGTPAISDILRTSEPPRVTLKANPSRRSDNDDNEVVPFVTQDSFLSTTPTEQRSPSSGFSAWLSHAVSPLMLMQAANVPRVSTHAIPIFPPSASLSPSVSPHHVVFVFATTVQRIRQYAPLWLHWLQPLQNCIVLVNGAGGTDRDETQRYLSSDLGLKKCQVVANGQKQAHNDFAANLLMAAGTAADMDWSDWYGKRIQPKYLVLLPDDALVGDEKAIRAILGENPSGKERIICGEDFAVPNVCTGHQGVLMTFSLARLISNRLERCLGSLPKHDNLWASCFKSASGDNQDLKMRLMSTMSDPGSSHRLPFLRLKDAIPTSQREAADYEAVAARFRALTTLIGPENLFRIYQFDGGSTTLVLGHSLVVKDGGEQTNTGEHHDATPPVDDIYAYDYLMQRRAWSGKRDLHAAAIPSLSPRLSGRMLQTPPYKFRKRNVTTPYYLTAVDLTERTMQYRNEERHAVISVQWIS